MKDGRKNVEVKRYYRGGGPLAASGSLVPLLVPISFNFNRMFVPFVRLFVSLYGKQKLPRLQSKVLPSLLDFQSGS